MLESGRARLSLRSAHGRRLTFRIVGPGYLLGLAATILGESYIFTAELLEESRVIFIARPDVLQLLREHSGRCFDVLQQLSAELAEMPLTMVPVQARRRASVVSGRRL
jgi:CRP-like cAMP-binding protein